MGRFVRLVAAGAISTVAGAGSMTVEAQQTVVVTGYSGGCGSNCNPYGASYSNGPSYSGSNSNIPESEAYAWLDAARKIADAFVNKFELPCVVRNEAPAQYVLRAQAECLSHVTGQMPWYTFGFKVTAAQVACNTLNPDISYKVSNPSDGDFCRG